MLLVSSLCIYTERKFWWAVNLNGKINLRKLFRLESNVGLTVGGCRCTVARDVLKCLLAGLLANQHHSADAFANVQKLFQLAALSSVGNR
jgi:hypothetical protein